MTQKWALWSALAPVLACLAVIGLLATPTAALAPAHANGLSAAFPVSVTSQGRTVRIDKKPLRILCVSASATQMLYAIGAGRQVVAVDKYSTYPPQAPRSGLTGAETSAEDYVRYHPDLVIVAYDEGTMVQQLAKLGVPALVLPPATNMAGVYAQLRELGLATGHGGAAAGVVSSLRRYLAHQVSEAQGKGRAATYYIELSPQPLYTATSATFVGAEFSLFGMRDIADKAGHGAPYPEISAEYLLAANPGWVFLADTVCCHATPANFARRPGFDVLSAVKDHHVLGVNDSVASQWGPHTIEEFTGFLARELRG
jgi:iron complex transport system substrate-binding protein